MKGFSRSSLFYLHTALVAAFVLLLAACANMGTPDGGPYDETPPKIVRTTPEFGASKVKGVKKVVIEFDEIIKIENAQEKVIVSPPQMDQPEIEANGKKVTVTLLDSLKPNMTYTIDFADAIVDNNEGNPYGDYAFTFSTGEKIDTFQVSGNVLEAKNLEPIKGMLVGLYKVGDADDANVKELHDSVFHTIPFERISRTDSRGHFVIKGLAPGAYRAFALEDKNQNYIYDQKAEKVAFSSRILETSSRPDVRKDTIWHDSIYYDSIKTVHYTHFYPDDIVLLAFDSDKQDRYLVKSERPVLEQFSLYFTAPSDTLPFVKGLNFDSDNAFVVESSAGNDTITYWIRDSLVYNIDTLEIQLDYFATDTTGNLSIVSDTLSLVSKLTKARIAKQKQARYDEWVKECKQRAKEERRAAKREAQKAESDDDEEAEDEAEVVRAEDEKKSGKKKKKHDEDEEFVVPPLPEEFLEYNVKNTSKMDPDKNVDFEFEEPLDSVDITKIHFRTKVDSLFVPTNFLFRQIKGETRRYRLYAEWEPDSTYQIEIDTAAFVNIYGKRNEAMKRSVKTKSLASCATLFVTLQNADTTAIVQLLDGGDKPVKTVKAKDGKADFYFLNPATYYMRMFYDLNGNGKWDTGDYDQQLQPEPVYYFTRPLVLKANWEFSEDWNPTAVEIPKQKPAKITKQKPDKAKSPKNKNAERLKNLHKK